MTYRLSASADSKDVWVSDRFPDPFGKEPYLLPDGTNIYKRVADGDTANLGFVPKFVQSNRGHVVGDLLWTTGSIKIASQRFVEVLTELDVTGFKTFAVEVFIDKRLRDDFTGLTITGTNAASGVYKYQNVQFFKFLARDDVVHGLRGAGVDRLVFEEYDG